MFNKKKFNSLDIARQIIKNTGLDENLGIIKQKNHAHSADSVELLKLVMALSTTNLVQTMKSDFIVQGLPEEIRNEIIREYIVESFRKQDLRKLKGKELEEATRVVMELVRELNKFWDEAVDPQGTGPGPRYYCVKEVLKKLGGEINYDLHDALFELMYLQYRHYFRYFQGLMATA
jgi:hypothetical protein